MNWQHIMKWHIPLAVGALGTATVVMSRRL
ncbi:MAG: hypothetical protein ACI8RE_002981, partial [Ilumatobacter sp.]